MKIEQAIKKAGSVRKLAEQLGVSTQAVYQMRKRALARAAKAREDRRRRLAAS